jgi:hypothetical protein
LQKKVPGTDEFDYLMERRDLRIEKANRKAAAQ